jgi:hypothetical protein
MDSLNQQAGTLCLVLLFAVAFLAVWLVWVHVRARRTESRLDEILGGVDSSNTAHMLIEYLSTVRATAAAVQRVESEQQRLAAIMPSAIRHVGLVRFSPFHDTGGDQSFALALLDGQGDGVVVTGLHSRHDSRLYAKPIESGSSTYSLTPEEREAMERALGSVGV